MIERSKAHKNDKSELMEKLDDNEIMRWQEEGRQVIPQNFAEFRKLCTKAKEFLKCGDYSTAAVYSEMAASYAVAKHCGLFASSELEHILLEIGQVGIQTRIRLEPSIASTPSQMHILHVASSVMDIGGLSKMLWRWIQQDSKNVHSLVLTRQSPNHRVPSILRETIVKGDGSIHVLNESIGNLISWSKRLRKIAASADLVILHIHNDDVIPILAFANKEQSPPILFLDHADHMFWLGTSVSDVVISLRESGMHLAQKRRNIQAERNVLLPIILEPIQRSLSRIEAKRHLGIPESSVVLLSIARGVKYRTMNGVSFADAHVKLLKQCEQVILIIVGLNEPEDWVSAIKQTQGRIRVIGETNETDTYYQAADIYVDSFPFTSNTSLLEAGSYGLPLVSRYPYSSDACKILGTDMPGLAGHLLEVQDLEKYTEVLLRLIISESFRLSLGESTRKKITEIHTGAHWEKCLYDAYDRASNMPKMMGLENINDKIIVEQPDVFLPSIYGWDINLDFYLQYMPLIQRVKCWINLGKQYRLRERINLLFPAWLSTHYVRLKARVKNTIR